MEFVSGNGKEIDGHFFNIEGHLSCRLYGIRVKGNTSFTGDPSYLGDGLDGPHFVVRVHDAYEDGSIRQCLLYIFRIYNAVLVNREIGYGDAASFEILTGLENGVVLDCGGDDMIAAIFAGAGDALDGEIIRLCPAARKHDLR
jgi:hypothetical protein